VAPRRRRRTAYEPTEADRNTVNAMAAIGIKQDDMARVLKIAPKTLRKHFSDELELGMIKANAAVGGALFTLATKPGPGQATAAIFWSKTRMGWKEPAQAHEHSGPDGKPIEVRQITFTIVRPGETGDAVTPKGKRKKED
jgi:hypothetical protein